MAMVVLPANRKIVLSDLRDMLGDRELKLASEDDFISRFPDCELGAMPPFGNLYGLKVYVARSLADEPEIAFNAGTHREVIKRSYNDLISWCNQPYWISPRCESFNVNHEIYEIHERKELGGMEGGLSAAAAG